MLSRKHRIVFFGSSPITLPLLNEIYSSDSIELSCVVTQPDRPHGRGQKLSPNEVKCWAQGKGILVLQPEKPNEETVTWMKEHRIDMGIVMAYGHILSEEIINASRCGMINFHGSLLPCYRGASPIEAAIASGDRQTGVSLMRVVKKMDAGAVLDAERIPIEFSETTPDVFMKIAEACRPLMRRNWDVLLEGRPAWIEQDEAKVSYARKLHPTDASLDFGAHWQVLVNRIRALWQRPGAKADYEGIPLRFSEAEGEPCEHDLPNGSIIDILPDTLVIAVNGGILKIGKVQRPGGKWLSPKEFINGFPLKQGYVFPSAAMLPLVGKTPKF